jgi:PBSX family phage terminase large subunit
MVAAVASDRELHVTLYPAQDAFVFDESRYPAFIGGRNAGKTFSGALKAYLRAREGGLGVIAAPSFPMLMHGAKRQFIERLQALGIDYRENKNEGWLYVHSFNAEVLFATLESESRVRGPNFDWGWGDEIEYLTDMNVWKAFKGAVRAGGHPQLFVTSTPKGRRLIWQEWVRDRDDNHTLHKATTHDNPFIDSQDYVAGLGYTGRFAAQEIGAEFVSYEGLVYERFDRDRHVSKQNIDGWRTVLGVDVGSRNPTAVLTVCIAGDDRVHVRREVYRRNLSSTDILDAVKTEADLSQPDAIYVDPSAAGYIDDLRRMGYRVKKANNDVLEGIGRVTDVLAHGFTIDPSCVNTIAEFESYRYPEGGKQDHIDKPLKENDHAMDALRYAILGESAPKPKLVFG